MKGGILRVSLLATTLLAACGGSSTPPTTPTMSGGVTADATAASTPSIACPSGVPGDICRFAETVEDHVRTGDVAALVVGSTLDTRDGRSLLTEALTTLNPVGARLVSIGCPFAATALGCAGTFGLAFSSLAPGVNPSEGESGVIALAYVRDPACDFSVIYSGGTPGCLPSGQAGTPALTGVSIVTDRTWRHALTKGGFVQGGTLAGIPRGITDTTVRSEWFPLSESSTIADSIGEVPIEDWRLDQPVSLDGVLYIESGCWGCEGYSASLDRVYRDASGQLVRETLIEGNISGVVVRSGPAEQEPMVAEILVTRCVSGYCGPLNAVTPDAASELLRSRDGGITWETLASLPGAADVRDPESYAAPAGEIVLGRSWGTGDPREWPYWLELWPSGTVLTQPNQPYRPSIRAPDGRLAYRTDDGLRYVFSDGTVFWQSPFGDRSDDNGVWLQSGPRAGIVLASFSDGAHGRRTLVAVFDGPDLRRVFAADQTPTPRVWLGPDLTALGNVEWSPSNPGLSIAGASEAFRSPMPAVINYGTGSVALVEPEFFIQAFGQYNRRWVDGWLPGPAVKVTGTGDGDARVHANANPCTRASDVPTGDADRNREC